MAYGLYCITFTFDQFLFLGNAMVSMQRDPLPALLRLPAHT
jgi:hypothetical protein